jgi:hypothetical protein
MGGSSTQDTLTLHNEFEFFMDAMETGIALLYNTGNENKETKKKLDETAARNADLTISSRPSDCLAILTGTREPIGSPK